MLVEENQGFISMIIDSIEEQLRTEQLGMTMTVVKTGLKPALDSIDYSKYCGMFLIATEVMRDEFSALDSIPIPFVVVDNTVPNHYCSSVCMNNAENVHIALQYCRECGQIYPHTASWSWMHCFRYALFLHDISLLFLRLPAVPHFPRSHFRQSVNHVLLLQVHLLLRHRSLQCPDDLTVSQMPAA